MRTIQKASLGCVCEIPTRLLKFLDNTATSLFRFFSFVIWLSFIWPKIVRNLIVYIAAILRPVQVAHGALTWMQCLAARGLSDG